VPADSLGKALANWVLQGGFGCRALPLAGQPYFFVKLPKKIFMGVKKTGRVNFSPDWVKAAQRC